MTELFSPNCIYRKNSFFNKPTYLEELKKEFNSNTASCLYKSNREEPINNTSRSLIPSLSAQALIIPPMPRPALFGDTLSEEPSPWKFKRLIVQTKNGIPLDAAIMGRPTTLSNKKWVLVSVGRKDIYEEKLLDRAFQKFLTQINANALLFNYPSVGGTPGTCNAKNLVESYQTMLHFLEDSHCGIGAKKIIGYGYSMGGGIQGEALKTYDLQEGIKKGIQYIFIKDRTFSTLERACKSLTKGWLQWLVPHSQLSLESLESSKKLAELQIPEVIIQTTDMQSNTISDGVISKAAALQTAIKTLSVPHKWFINFTENCIKEAPKSRSRWFLHTCSIEHFVDRLSQRINSLMRAHLLTLNTKKN